MRDFIQVQKVIKTHLDFLNINKSGLWNLGTGQASSFELVARTIAKEYNARVEYIDMPDILKDSYQAYTCADMQNLNNTCNIK
jgi:ADP-L-glycero-D-manno-heptose 6-epimerase